MPLVQVCTPLVRKSVDGRPAFGGKPVRTTEIGGETWFCGKDVCDSLGMTGDTSHLTKAYGIVAAEVRVITKTQANPNSVGIKIGYPNRGLTFINATAVRRIAQRSNKPAARQFQDFLNGTVSEAIERDGAKRVGHPSPGYPA